MSSSYDFQAHLQHSQRCCCSQTALQWFEVLQGLSLALSDLSPALLAASRNVVGTPRVVTCTPTCSPTDHNHSHGTSIQVIRDPSYSEGWHECPPTVWHSPEIDASKFTLHILSDTPGGSQWLNYILLMKVIASSNQFYRSMWTFNEFTSNKACYEIDTRPVIACQGSYPWQLTTPFHDWCYVIYGIINPLCRSRSILVPIPLLKENL